MLQIVCSVMDILFLFNDIAYDDTLHRYTNVKTGQVYTSSTQYIGKFKKHFNEEYWLRYKVLKNNWIKVHPGMSLEELDKKVQNNLLESEVEKLRKDWEQRRIKGQTEGSLTHDILQHAAHRRHNMQGLSDQSTVVQNKVKHGKKALADLFDKGYIVVATEFVIADDELGVSGMIDLLLYNSNTGLLEIWDWKTDNTIEMQNKYDKLQDHLSYLDDCNYNKYRVQLSIYATILERKGLTVGAINIIHLSEENYTIYPLQRVENPINNDSKTSNLPTEE